jgi:hypothetical protein
VYGKASLRHGDAALKRDATFTTCAEQKQRTRANNRAKGTEFTVEL